MGFGTKLFKATYLGLGGTGIADQAGQARELIVGCRLCPRNCAVDRTVGETGYCRTADRAVVASWGPHFGEEAPLVGMKGSGTIFFSNCNLGCIFCQNWSISHVGEGMEMSSDALAAVMMELQGQGCHNINLVTPTHQVPMILDALVEAVERGLRVPLVYNCGGYESVETLRLLDGVIDIYMPDFKYADTAPAAEYSDAPDYPEVAKAALREMHRQVGDLTFNGYGIARRGLLVRHLVLPAGLAGTPEVVRFLAEEISRDTYLNIMDQYRPCADALDRPPLDRCITRREYQEALDAAQAAGLERIDGLWRPETPLNTPSA
jgi:putative pyruvate formate lyase activating enzyme